MAKKVVKISAILFAIVMMFLLSYIWLNNQVKNGNFVMIKSRSVEFSTSSDVRRCFDKVHDDLHMKKSEIYGGDNQFYIKSDNGLYGVVYVYVNKLDIKYEIALLLRNMKKGDEDLISDKLNSLYELTAKVCNTAP